MKAGIYHGVKNISIQEIAKPSLNNNDVIIKVAKAGICGTDVHAYLHGGDLVGIYEDNQFGHELVGVIDEVGKDIKDIKIGDRVTICPTARRPISCGLNSTEIADMSGAFSEYVYVEDAKKDYNVFILPDSLKFEHGVLTEPLSVASHGVALAELKGSEKAVIYGAGTIGLCTIAALQNKGIKDIIVSDVIDTRLNVAKEMGATVFNSKNGGFIDFVKETWGVHKGNSYEDCINADVVIDCAGLPFIIKEFMDNAKTSSKLIVIAVHGKDVEISPYWMLAKEVTIKGSRGYTPEDIITSINTLGRKDSKLHKMITGVYDHQDLVSAFEKASDPQSAIKVVMDYKVY